MPLVAVVTVSKEQVVKLRLLVLVVLVQSERVLMALVVLSPQFPLAAEVGVTAESTREVTLVPAVVAKAVALLPVVRSVG